MAAIERAVGPERTASSIFVSAMAWLGYFFLIMPSLIVLPMSFGNKFEMMFPPTSFSTYLFEQFLFEENWMDATVLSFRVAIGSTLLALSLGVPAAYGLVRGNYWGKKLVAMILISPIMVPVIVVALGLYLYFTSVGLRGSEFALIIGHAVYTGPFVIVTCMAGMRHIDVNLEVAASIMGAGALLVFWKVTLPLLRPAMLASGLFAFLMSFDEIVISYFLSAIGSMTLPVKMFSSIQWEISPVLAAVSTMLTLLSLVICLIGASFQKKSQDSYRP